MVCFSPKARLNQDLLAIIATGTSGITGRVSKERHEVRYATPVALFVIRLTGLNQIVLGALFWTGNARALTPVHMLIGFVLVLLLWVLAALTARAGIDPG